MKIMHTIDVNSAIKRSAYFSISLACFAFVSWQSVQCIQKYIEKPQGTKLTLQHTSEIPQFPSITICPTNFSSGMVILQFSDLETILMALGL